ncbi:MAG: archaeosortase/exosortase family protein [Acidobacteriota bacterium]|nr:MAG: archaeosortase/exosortase family protein [Acidobacteriota bacterium]
MADSMRRPAVLLAIQMAAFWPVWIWYFRRMTDSSDSGWGWTALVAAIALSRLTGSADGRKRPATRSLWLPGALTLAYAVGYPLLSPLPRAAIAVLAIGATISAIGNRLHAGIYGLLLLSLPVMASLQFYLGYPLRALIAVLSAGMLRVGGLTVISDGATLHWGDQSILIDAPCSGIRMLWAGALLTMILAAVYRLRPWHFVLAGSGAFILIIIGNLFRSVALFYLEAGLIELPKQAHEAIGVAAFLMTAIAIVWHTRRMGGRQSCAA